MQTTTCERNGAGESTTVGPRRAMDDEASRPRAVASFPPPVQPPPEIAAVDDDSNVVRRSSCRLSRVARQQATRRATDRVASSGRNGPSSDEARRRRLHRCGNAALITNGPRGPSVGHKTSLKGRRAPRRGLAQASRRDNGPRAAHRLGRPTEATLVPTAPIETRSEDGNVQVIGSKSGCRVVSAWLRASCCCCWSLTTTENGRTSQEDKFT